MGVRRVAPYVGAWIETLSPNGYMRAKSVSHPTWVRGLKLRRLYLAIRYSQSHPTWVRRLKLNCGALLRVTFVVAPYVGAWIETNGGLNNIVSGLCRTLRGCVD